MAYQIKVKMEVRKYTEEIVSYSDKKSGKASTYTKRFLNVENPETGDPAIVKVWDNVDIPAGIKRGDLITVDVTGFKTEKDVTTFTCDSVVILKTK